MGMNGTSDPAAAGPRTPLFRALKKKKTPERLSLRLEFERKVLYETSDFSSVESITIGRSSECVWVIPKEDGVASGHHAVIMMRSGKLCLRDTGSRNGIFYKARKIQEKVLAPGDQFSIGNCTLFVESVKSVRTTPHELVFLNTDRKNESLKLNREKILLGSAPGCDYVIEEQLVSQKHAEFHSKADGCWLKDLGSKNGTFVNGTRLSPATERLLADDDVISIAFVDFKFVDGTIEHSKIRIWSSLAVIGITIFIVLAINWLWMSLKASSDICLTRARAEAAAERFEKAHELLRESRSLRGAENNEVAYHELENSIAVWEKVHADWNRARSELRSEKWIEATRVLGVITDADPNIWGWNDTTAPAMRKEAFNVKKLLDAYLSAGTAMLDDRSRKSPADLKNIAGTIRETEESFASDPPEYLQKLLAEAGRLRERISRNLMYLEKLDSILARIESESDNLTLVLEDLNELKTHADPGIRIRIENCMVPLSMLQRSGKQIKRALICVQQLDFAELNNLKLDLPTLEQCAVNGQIATLRKDQERQFAHILSAAANLQPLIRGLRDAGLADDGILPPCLAILHNPAVMEKVLACDAFDYKMPARLRSTPSGEYDHILGIEAFFEYIYALPAPYDHTIYSEFQFRPEIVKVRELLAAVKSFHTFANQKEHLWLHAGIFLNYHESAEAVLKTRDRLAVEFLNANPKDLRAQVLCRAIAVFLMEGNVPEASMEALIADFKKLRQPLMQLSRDYNSASDERKIEIRTAILAGGLPGDPLTRRMWGFKKYSR